LKLEQIAENALIQVCDRGYPATTNLYFRALLSDEARPLKGGLGLAIVKTLVEGMVCHSSLKLGEGSIFIVTLPTNY